MSIYSRIPKVHFPVCSTLSSGSRGDYGRYESRSTDHLNVTLQLLRHISRLQDLKYCICRTQCFVSDDGKSILRQGDLFQGDAIR